MLSRNQLTSQVKSKRHLLWKEIFENKLGLVGFGIHGTRHCKNVRFLKIQMFGKCSPTEHWCHSLLGGSLYIRMYKHHVDFHIHDCCHRNQKQWNETHAPSIFSASCALKYTDTEMKETRNKDGGENGPFVRSTPLLCPDRFKHEWLHNPHIFAESTICSRKRLSENLFTTSRRLLRNTFHRKRRRFVS